MASQNDEITPQMNEQPAAVAPAENPAPKRRGRPPKKAVGTVEAVETAIENFNNEASSLFGWKPADAAKNLDVDSYADFFEKRIEAQYYAVYTDPDAKK